MTFQQQEELFPSFGADDAFIKGDTNTFAKVNVDEPAEKDTAKTNEAAEANKKRKAPEKFVEKKEANQPPDSWFKLEVNTHVYVTGLPEDVTFDEVVEVFSKCGVIKEACYSHLETHAVKVVANLAAEEKIVQEEGLDAQLILLRTSENTTLLRVASGAIANLAMNELNQALIICKGCAALLAHTTSKTDDPQTLRMVARTIANLCGNGVERFPE